MNNSSVTEKECHKFGVFVSFAYFWVNSVGCYGEFYVVLKHFQNPQNLIFNILKEKIAYLLPCGLFFR